MRSVLFGRAQPEAQPGDGAQLVPVSLFETEHEWVVVAPMPGMEAQDLSIEIDADRIVLRSCKRGPGQDRLRYVRREWSYGPYEVSVELPAPAAIERANASYGNGILSIAIPKAAPKGPAPRELVIAADPAHPTRGERVGHRGLAEACAGAGPVSLM